MSELNLDQDEPQIIKTVDEDGTVHNFELIDIVEIDEQEYGLLVHVDEEETEVSEDEDDEEEVVIMKLSKKDDAYTFETIEDEEEFNKVIEYLESESESGCCCEEECVCGDDCDCEPDCDCGCQDNK